MVNFFRITFTLFLVIDPLGNIPTYLTLLEPFDKKKRKKIMIRELLIALGLMLIFHYFGQILLTLLGVSPSTVRISGGIILFLIAIRLIFSHEETKVSWGKHKPFVVPIATPIIAGPSVLSMIMIFAQEEPSDLFLLGAVFLAWIFSSILFFFAKNVLNILKKKGLFACQRLMGLIVGFVAIQVFVEGLKIFFYGQ